MPRPEVRRRSSRTLTFGSLSYRVLSDADPVETTEHPLVLVHGVGMSHRYFSRLHDELARTHRVFSIDMPGYAGLPKPDHNAGIAEAAEGLGLALDALGLTGVTLVGHSMGAQWTAELAAQRPDLIGHLVIIGPVTDDHRRSLPQQMLSLGVDTFVETPAANVIVFTDYLRCGMPWYLQQVSHMLDYRLEERMPDVSAPVLVMRGAKDPIAPARWCRELRDLAPAGAFVTIPGCAHVAQHSGPRAVASAIRAFVAGEVSHPQTGAASETKRPGRASPLKIAVWWARDYLYAGLWQVRAFFSRTDPSEFLSGEGTPIVALPGIYETWKFLQPLVGSAHERGHPVHVLGALGRSRRPVVEMADRVAAYLSEHDLTDVVLLAHSRGGLVGKQVMIGPAADRIRGMVAVATPFAGSWYASLMWTRSLRSLRPRDATIVSLATHADANARIVSIYGLFDPHIPGGSELVGAKNVQLETGGHFRILAHPRVIAEVVAFAE